MTSDGHTRPHMAAGDELVLDRVVYLASLASKPELIDPQLDRVRKITATMLPYQVDPARYMPELRQVEADLKYHLTHKDPLRLFTAEMLEQKIAEHFSMRKSPQLKRLRWQMIGLCVALVGMYDLGLIFFRDTPWPARAQLAVPFMILAQGLGNAWLYLSAVRDFKEQFRRAYAFIAIGILWTIPGAAQFPILIANDSLLSLPWFQYGGFMVTFVFVCLAIYLGVRLFAKLMKLKGHLVSRKKVLGAAVIASLAVVIIPHPADVDSEFFFHIPLVSVTLCAVFSIASAILIYRIINTASSIYNKALWWFLVTTVITLIGNIEYGLLIYLHGEMTKSLITIGMIPFAILSWTMLYAGYLFKRSSEY